VAREIMGTAVVGGMIAETFISRFFVPAISYVVERVSGAERRRALPLAPAEATGSWVASVGQDAPVKGLQYPRIMAKVNLLAEHGRKDGIVFTAKKTGVYRFSAGIVPYKFAAWALQTNWNDPVGHYQAYSCISDCQQIEFLG
jgi:hypothetical protein